MLNPAKPGIAKEEKTGQSICTASLLLQNHEYYTIQLFFCKAFIEFSLFVLFMHPVFC